jgi:hypothetical protein
MRAQEKTLPSDNRVRKRREREAKAPALGLEAVSEPNAPWGLPLLVPRTGLLCVAFLHRAPGLSRGHALGKLAHLGNCPKRRISIDFQEQFDPAQSSLRPAKRWH